MSDLSHLSKISKTSKNDSFTRSSSSSSKPFFKKTYTSEKNEKNFFLSLIGMTFIISMFSLWMIVIIIFIQGGNLTRIILIILYIIQLTINQQSKLFINCLNYLGIIDYFKSYTLIIEEEIADNHSLICGHPHGIMCFGGGLMMMTDMLGKLKVTPCVTRILMFLPVSGIFARLLGFKGVNNEQFKNFLERGDNLFFLPGGFECATVTNHNKDRVFIKNRIGFIKYALQNGYKVYPMYTFNENKTYYTFNLFQNFRLFLSKFKVPGCLFIGKYLIYPREDIDLLTVIGKPLILPKIENPSMEEVKQFHAIYMNLLNDMYNKYKLQNYSSEKLEMF